MDVIKKLKSCSTLLSFIFHPIFNHTILPIINYMSLCYPHVLLPLLTDSIPTNLSPSSNTNSFNKQSFLVSISPAACSLLPYLSNSLKPPNNA